MEQFEVVYVKFLNLNISDHIPFTSINYSRGRRGRPFKFFNHMAAHPQFQALVDKAWKGSYDGVGFEKVWVKLKRVKTILKTLYKCEYEGIYEKIRLW